MMSLCNTWNKHYVIKHSFESFESTVKCYYKNVKHSFYGRHLYFTTPTNWSNGKKENKHAFWKCYILWKCQQDLSESPDCPCYDNTRDRDGNKFLLSSCHMVNNAATRDNDKFLSLSLWPQVRQTVQVLTCKVSLRRLVYRFTVHRLCHVRHLWFFVFFTTEVCRGSVSPHGQKKRCHKFRPIELSQRFA